MRTSPPAARATAVAAPAGGVKGFAVGRPTVATRPLTPSSPLPERAYAAMPGASRHHRRRPTDPL